MEQNDLTEPITITKLVNGGQGLARLSNQQVIFVWNSLPGETVRARVYRTKRGFAEGVAEEIISASPDRVLPRDAAYLATSPWQILTKEAEEKAKIAILGELLAGIKSDFSSIQFYQSPKQWHYRNKMEYTFDEADSKLQLAFHQRGQHSKQIVSGSSLADELINMAAEQILSVLDSNGVRSRELKTLVLRSSNQGEVAASIFIKRRKNKPLPPISSIKNISLFYSNPKSPNNQTTELLYQQGDGLLSDQLLDKRFYYDAESFFQVNLDAYKHALVLIREELDDHKLVDIYAGVGSIGLSVAKGQLDLIENDKYSASFAKLNAEQSQFPTRVIIAPAEATLESIDSHSNVVVDPPRAGLHRRLVNRMLIKKPPKIIYLSCNPATLCRDLDSLKSEYRIKSIEIINFFPKTPHIETLAILERKSNPI